MTEEVANDDVATGDVATDLDDVATRNDVVATSLSTYHPLKAVAEG
jgi:hypothetical protein